METNPRQKGLGQSPNKGPGNSKSSSSTGSDSGSTEEEEKLRKLFQACDRDADGYIDSQDIQFMCQQLNMEESVEEIMMQLGADDEGRISFEEFARCRMRLVNEIEQEKMCADPTFLLSAPVPPSGSGVPWHSGPERTIPSPSTDIPTLHKLLRMKDAAYYQQIENRGAAEMKLLDTLNSMYIDQISSLRRENQRLQHVTVEKERLEKQLCKIQSEKNRTQQDFEGKMEHISQNYEERITELHSVIAELRKKIDHFSNNIIREEDEFEGSDVAQEDVSLNENNANDSQHSASIADIAPDLNIELSKVAVELDRAIQEGRLPVAGDKERPTSSNKSTADSLSCSSGLPQLSNRPNPLQIQLGQKPIHPNQFTMHIRSLLDVNNALHKQVSRQQEELQSTRGLLETVTEERDSLKRKVHDKSMSRQTASSPTSPAKSHTSSPTKGNTKTPQNPAYTKKSTPSKVQDPVIPKVAELKKLKTESSDRHITGAEMSSFGMANSQVAEHLSQSFQDGSNIQEMLQKIQEGDPGTKLKLHEFEIELERLQSKIDHLKAQNDVLLITVEESKSHCNRLTLLIGKYESNNCALQMALQYLDQAVEVYDVMVMLLEGEIHQLLANCKAAGLGFERGDDTDESMDPIEVSTNIIQQAHLHRKSVENVAKQLLQRLEQHPVHSNTRNNRTAAETPWEELSSSRTGSTTSSTTSSGDTDFTKLDEKKLKDHIRALKTDRNTVNVTVMELESIHLDPFGISQPSPKAQRLDLENAVLLQELMAVKEEKAELKAQNYLLEKEKAALELRLSGKMSQEQAYLVQIEHLKCEVKEREVKLHPEIAKNKKDGDESSTTPSITLAELRSSNPSEIAQDLAEALKRESQLKRRVQELMITLEKLSKNSEIRHQQSADFVNDLKQANSALVAAFEKAKKKYQAKVKKLEERIHILNDRLSKQGQLVGRKGLSGEEDTGIASETSL